MPRVLLLIALLLEIGLLTQCGQLPLPIPSAPPFPTVGPVQRISGSTHRTTAVLQASTNCADIGEMVTFTASFTNTVPYPITITTEPVLDIVLIPAQWDAADGPEPIQRWSESDQYPENLPNVMQAGEEWVYQWRWQADPMFHSQGSTKVLAQLQRGQIQLQNSAIPAGGPEVEVGVAAMHLPGGGAVECYELERALQP